jgi:hypothetical protein
VSKVEIVKSIGDLNVGIGNTVTGAEQYCIDVSDNLKGLRAFIVLLEFRCLVGSVGSRMTAS